MSELESGSDGLSTGEAETRLKQYGPNEIAREQRKSVFMRLWDNVKNPLVILLTVLALVSYATGDMRATAVIMVMVMLGVVLRFYQEMRADNAAEKLKAMVSTTATVMRDGKEVEVPLQNLVPGDISALRRGYGSGRCTAAFRQGFVHQPGRPHRRIDAGGENRRSVRRRT